MLLLVRCIRMDRTMAAASGFISSALGADPQTPVVFILSAGADPSNEILSLAHSLKLIIHPPVSMGQGQHPVARSLISACVSEGGWVLLQNCHLGIDFMQELLPLIQNDAHDEFRLWLTTAPSQQFPRALLHGSLKVACAPPLGVRAAMLRGLSGFDQDLLESVMLP